MAENYPHRPEVAETSNRNGLLRVTTSNWSSVGVATGSYACRNGERRPSIGDRHRPVHDCCYRGRHRLINPFLEHCVCPDHCRAPQAVTLSENGSLVFSGQNAISIGDNSGTAEQLVLSVVQGHAQF